MHEDPTILLHPRTKNLLGQTFGRLVVIAFAGYDSYRKAVWICQCQEGNIVIRGLRQLTLPNRIPSCGCFSRERQQVLHTTHGKSRSKEYGIWAGILSRCTSSTNKAYPSYGGRGITICDSWYDFSCFYADMGPRPSTKHSIERLRNNEGYSPENCVWATRKMQSRNTRRNTLLTHNGITQCLQDWALQVGIDRRCITARLRLGWDLADALTIPPGPGHRYKNLQKRLA